MSVSRTYRRSSAGSSAPERKNGDRQGDRAAKRVERRRGVHANNAAACPGSQTWGLGLHIEGTNPILTINGNVESNSQVYFGTGIGSSIIGSVKSPCTPLTAVFNPGSATISGSENGFGAPYADPINITVDSLDASCSFGTSVNTPLAWGI